MDSDTDAAPDPDTDTSELAREVIKELDTGTVIDDKIVVSRRGLTALMGAGLGAGALSMLGVEKASAQSAAGQVGTDADRVDLFAGAVDANSVKTEEADITNETLIKAETDANVSGIPANTPTSPSFGKVVKDELGEFASDGFTPAETGYYLVIAEARTEGGVSDGDLLQAKIQNVSDDTTTSQTPIRQLGGSNGFESFGKIVDIVELTAGKKYEYRCRNRTSSFSIDDAAGRFAVRSVFR